MLEVEKNQIEESKPQIGTDLTLLMRDGKTKEFKFDLEGYTWKWKYRQVSWRQHMQAVADCTEEVQDQNGKEGVKFDAAKYYEDLLIEIIVEGPHGRPLTREELRQLDSDVIAKLTNIVPSPLLNREVDQAKNS